MTIKLGAIDLPADLEWQDEFAWTPVQQAAERTLTGKLGIEEATKIKGRPITLHGGQNAAWVTRATVTALAATLTAGGIMTLVYHGTTYKVKWRHNDTPIDATPVVRTRNPGANTKYAITLRLMEVASA